MKLKDDNQLNAYLWERLRWTQGDSMGWSSGKSRKRIYLSIDLVFIVSFSAERANSDAKHVLFLYVLPE